MNNQPLTESYREIYIDNLYKSLRLLTPCITDDVCLWIACQSALETRYGTSNIFRNNNNLFGMKYPTKRPTCAICESKKHSLYQTPMSSIIDYLLWLSWSHINLYELSGLDNFLPAFKRTAYNSSDVYVDTVNKIFAKYSYMLNPNEEM